MFLYTPYNVFAWIKAFHSTNQRYSELSIFS